MPQRERPREARKPQPPPPAARPAASRSLVVLAWAAIAVYMAALTLYEMSNNDIWIHLKTGEYVITHGWVPIKDPYSFIASDRDYVAHEWLAGVLFYLVYAAGGVKGLIFFKAGVLAAACGLLILTSRRLGARLSVILPAFACLLYISSARYLERPHIFSYLMAALYLWLFFNYRERGRDRRWLYAIPPAHIVWTNLHGGYVQGLALVATFALGEALAWARARYLKIGAEKAPPARDVLLLGSLVPACLVATLVNPYGWRLLTFPFELTGLDLFMRTIYEWQPPYHVSYNASTMFFFYLIQVGALCASFFLAHADRTRSRAGGRPLALPNAAMIGALALTYFVLAVFWFQSPATHWKPDVIANILYFLLGLFCLFTAANLRSVDFTQAGVFALFFLMSLRHNRAVTDAAMATFPVLAASASALLDGRRLGAAAGGQARRAPPPGEAGTEEPAPPSGPPPDRSGAPALVFGSALLLAVAAHAVIFTYYFDFRGTGREKGFGIADNMPNCAVEFIARNRITGNAFVSYAFAAMLIHRMHPEVMVNMDSRNDVYGEQLYREYMGALSSPEGMRAYLERHRIDFFLLGYGDRVTSTFNWLDSTGEWAPVFYDTRSFILVRRTPETEDLIAREAYRSLKPAVVAPTSVDSTNAPLLLAESDKAIRDCPTSPLGYFYKAKALLFLGRHEESLEVSRQILAIDPRNVQAYADMGMAYATMGQRGRAIEMYEKALEIEPGYVLARENLKRLRGF